MFSVLLPIIYLSFISLGLPDGLLGAAWPTLYTHFDVPISFAGILQLLIAGSTVISSLQSDRLTKKFGPGLVTAFSVLTTAIALLGFSLSNSFILLALWAIPYGLGAGSVDAALNNYVSLHYKSRHMSWLHCMWGLGATVGPLFMSYALTHLGSWQSGYRGVFYIQVVLTIILFISLPLWKKTPIIIEEENNSNKEVKPLSLKEVLKIEGVKQMLIVFFCYCSIEQTTGLWAATYLVVNRGISTENAASFAGMFFLGITIGRAVSGFLTFKLNNKQMNYLGFSIIALGIIMLLLPINSIAFISLIIIGLGCAPIYPSLIHSTPTLFGKDKSQAIIGVQMASAYIGSSLMPPFFGFLSSLINISILPIYLTIILLLMITMYKSLLNKTSN